MLGEDGGAVWYCGYAGRSGGVQQEPAAVQKRYCLYARLFRHFFYQDVDEPGQGAGTCIYRRERFRDYRGSGDGAVDAFSDGSTVPGSLQQSGYGVAIRGAGSAATKAEYSGSCKASGNNYLAECLAMLCATQNVLDQDPLTL